jgi:hypothetical protein
MTEIDTTELDQQIAAAEAAAQQLRQAKAQAQAAASAAVRQTEIYQKQQAWLQAEAARRKAIYDSFVAGPLATVQAQAAAQADVEAQYHADLAELAELVARVRQMQARLTEVQATLFNGRDQAALALVKAILGHSWDDLWMNVDPSNPDAAALEQFSAWASEMFGADLLNEFLPSHRSTEMIVKAQAGALAFQIGAWRARHEWADSTIAAENAQRQRAQAARRLGLTP